ncbi:hypothetical protein EGW08_003206, partial [Elysia chlorotica]
MGTGMRGSSMTGNYKVSEKLDLVFLIHTSKALTNEQWDGYTTFMAGLVKHARVDSGEVRVGAVIYRKKGALIFPFTEHTTKAAVDEALGTMRIRRGTYTNSAHGMEVVRTKLLTPSAGDRPDAPNVVVVITDAETGSDAPQVPQQAQMLKATGAQVYAIGVGMPSRQELDLMASRSGDVFAMSTVEEFPVVQQQLINQIYALQERPLINTQSEIAATAPPSGETYGSDKLDLVFLYHTSPNIGPEEWETYKLFMSDVISGANIDSGEVRVGVALYTSNGVLVFPLSQYSNRAELEAALRLLPYQRSSDAAVASGLDLLWTRVFSTWAGDRPDAPNAVILVTDADSYLDRNRIAASAESLRAESRARIYTAGVGLRGSSQLASIASSSSAMFSAENVEDLADVKEALVRQMPPLSRRQDGSLIDPIDTGSLSITEYGTDKLDLVFLFHTSDRVDGQAWDRYKLFMNDVVAKADIDSGDVRVGAVFYNYQSAWSFPLSQYRSASEVAGAIDRLPLQPDRNANLALGMSLVQRMFTPSGGDRPDAPNAVIVLTDSDANVNVQDIQSEAETLRTQSRARIYTAGVGLRGSSQLSSVASSPSTFFAADTVAGLAGVRGEIVAQIPPLNQRQEESVTEPMTPQKEVSAADHFTSDKLDLVFLFHTSDRVDGQAWDRYKLFMNDVVAKADIDSGDVRVGAVFYNYQSAWSFPLSQYRSASEVAGAIDRLPLQPDRNANLALGMSLVQRMFTPSGGDRPDAPNAVIVLTDSDANVNVQDIQSEAETLRTQSRARIYTAGVGLRGSSQLSSVASSPSTFFAADTVAGLAGVRGEIVAQIPPLNQRQEEPVTEPMTPQKELSALDHFTSDKLDLVFLFHTSRNIDTSGWESYKRFMTDVVSGANIDSGDVRVGAVIYNYRSRWSFPLSQYTTRSSLVQAINSLPLQTDSYADLALGIDQVQAMFTSTGGDRPDVPNAVIVLTDADGNVNTQGIPAATLKLKTESRARIYTAGVGLRGSSQLSSVASSPSTFFAADDIAGLAGVKGDMVAQIPPLRASLTTEKPMTTEGDPESNPETSKKLDLAFLIHSSEAIDYDKYDYYTQFMHEVVEKADIDSGAVRVGAAIYNADGYVVFPLNQYTSSEALRAAIVEFPLQSSRDANLARGIDTLRQKMFTPSGGDRPDVPNAVIVVTDADASQDVGQIEPATQKLIDEATPKIYTAGIGLKGLSWLPAIASAPEDVYSPETVQDLPSVSGPIAKKTNALSGLGFKGQDASKLDLAFLIHTSSYVDGQRYQYYKNFMRTVIAGADIDSGAVRVGVVIYRHDGSVIFPLD